MESRSLELHQREEEAQIISRYRFKLATLKQDYKANHATWIREASKWAFAIGTFGLGSLYLWATTSIIKEGQVGLRRNARGELILLPPGRHSNFPWETYETPPQSLSGNFLKLGPYKIITVQTGYVAKTFRNGILEILGAGQHLLPDAAHVFNEKDGFVSIKEETKTLKPVTALTSDNIALEIKADVRYQIEDPTLAITKVDEIENTIFEIAKFNIAQVVSHHSLAEFVPVTMREKIAAENAEELEQSDEEGNAVEELLLPRKGLSTVLEELMADITAQFKRMGIKLLNIGITSWDYQDKVLAHELGQGAVLEAQVRSRILAADQAAKVRGIEATAESNAQRTIAEGRADAIKTVGDAYIELAGSMKDNPAAFQMWQTQQQVQMLAHGNNPHIIFQVGGDKSTSPQLNMPLVIENDRSSMGMVN